MTRNSRAQSFVLLGLLIAGLISGCGENPNLTRPDPNDGNSPTNPNSPPETRVTPTPGPSNGFPAPPDHPIPPGSPMNPYPPGFPKPGPSCKPMPSPSPSCKPESFGGTEAFGNPEYEESPFLDDRDPSGISECLPEFPKP